MISAPTQSGHLDSEVSGCAVVETASRVMVGATLTARAGTPVASAWKGPATLVALAGLAGFGAIFAAVRGRRTDAIDLALMLRLQRLRAPFLDRLMTAVSWPGFPPQSRMIPWAAVVGLWLVGFRTEAAFTAAAGTDAVSSALKMLMDRPRPMGTDLRVVAAPLIGSSFPSGHVITYVAIYGFLAYLAHALIRDPVFRRAAGAGLGGVIVLVGPSRIYQGHHWPTDVTASYFVGTTYLVIVVTAYRRAKAVEALACSGICRSTDPSVTVVAWGSKSRFDPAAAP